VVDATADLGVGANQTAFDGTTQGVTFTQIGIARDIVNGDNPSSAYEFDGVDDNIGVPLLPTNSDATVMCWFQSDDASIEQRLIALDDQPPNFILRLNPGGSNEIQALSNDTNGNQTVTTTAFDVTKIHHIAASFEENQQLTLYVDGNSVGSTPVAGRSTIFENNNHIGSNRGGSANFSDAIIDDPRLYGRVVPASEVNTVYRNTEPGQ
jgi:hypothetical protein